MATIKRFEDLEVWQKAREICNTVSTYIQKYDFSRDFTLRDQIRSSSGSAMDNIAESFKRDGNREFIQFCPFQKVQSEKHAHRLIEFLTTNIFLRKNSKY